MNETKKLTQLTKILRLERTITSTLNLNQILNLVMDMTLNLLNAEVGLLITYDYDTKQFIPSAVWGLAMDVIQKIYYKNRLPIIDWVAKRKSILVIKDFKTDQNISIIEPINVNINTLICAPLRTKNSLVGIIILANKILTAEEKFFSRDDIEILESITSQVAIAIENASFYEKLYNLQIYNENIINSIPTGIITTDTTGIVKTYNRSAEFILGIPKDKVIGQSISILFEKCKDKKFDILKTIKTNENLLSYEITLEKSPTQYIVLNISTSILRDMHNKIIGSVIVLDDLTEKKLLEASIRRSEQLSALGELAAGISHEIKNPLTSMKGFTQLLPSKIGDEKFQKKYIEVMSKEIDRLNQIVERLLSFAKPQVKGFVKYNVNDAIKNTLALLHFQLQNAKVKVKFISLDGIKQVYANPQQLEQVFINIILNAIDAMPKGGLIEITTGMILKKELDKKYWEYVSVKISDTGNGIPETELDKLFNPFYSTKEKGSGLGLFISNQIITEHKGNIEVNSRLGKGTTFTINIPVAE